MCADCGSSALALTGARIAIALLIRRASFRAISSRTFWQALNRYLVWEVGDEFATHEPEDYRWLTVYQLMLLLRAGSCLNVELRSLLACLTTWIGR